MLDQQPVDLSLGHRRPATLLARVHELGIGRGALQHALGYQAVVDDHLRGGE